MMLELARCLTEWLSHPVYGVAALLTAGAVPRDAGDDVPTIATITNEFDDRRVAAGRLPELLPALAIDVQGLSVVENQVVAEMGDGRIVARIRYGDSRADLAQAKVDGSYVMRAVAQSLRLLNRQPWEAWRTRNDLWFLPATDGAVEIRPFVEQLDDVHVTGLCLATYALRDFAPLPA